MGVIGTFGKKISPHIKSESKTFDTVEIAETSIRLKNFSDVPTYPMMEFARLVTLPVATKSYVAQATIYSLFEAIVHDDDFPAFRAAATNLTGQELVDAALALYEAWAAVPFELRPDSSDGLSETSETSNLSSSESSDTRDDRTKKQEELEAAIGLT